MRDSTMAMGRIIALVLATLTVVFYRPGLGGVQHAITPDKVIHAQEKTAQKTPNPASPTASIPKTSSPSSPPVVPPPTLPPEPLKPVEPPKPAVWAVKSAPNGTLEGVNKALSLYQDMGLSKQGAAMLVGNFLQEMPQAFRTGDPCHTSGTGDGGLALGFGQWHPGRRVDMPCGFTDQLTWAVNTEMVRDNRNGGGHNLGALVRNNAATPLQLDHAIKLWERYGYKGSRYEYGLSILGQL